MRPSTGAVWIRGAIVWLCRSPYHARMLEPRDCFTVLCLAALAAGCGEVRLGALPPDASDGPGAPDAARAADAAPVDAPGPAVDAGGPAPDAGGTLDPSLIAWYPLDTSMGGVTPDASGNGRDATCAPLATICPPSVPGRLGMAMAFGDPVHLRVANGDGYFDTTDGFTIAAWAFLIDEDSDPGAVMSKPRGNGFQNSWQLEFEDGGTLAFTTSNGQDHEVERAPQEVTLGTWVHVAGTWDGIAKQVYINGSVQGGEGADVVFDGSDIVIGADQNEGTIALPFGGLIDDVRIYDRALDGDEIAALAAGR
jgi:hypothetical protein